MAGAFPICANALVPRRGVCRRTPRPDHDTLVALANVGSCVVQVDGPRNTLRRCVSWHRSGCDLLRTSVRRKSPRHCAAHQGADTTIARPALDAETCLSARGARCHRRNAATALRRRSRVFWDVPRVAAGVPAHCFRQRCFHCRGSRHVQPCASVFDQGRYGAERSTRR